MECPYTVSIAQISFHPAYISSGINYLEEPFGDESTFLSRIQEEEILQLTQQLKERYLRWLKTKIEVIIKACLELGSDLLVFPEYSIPAELLEDIALMIKGSMLTVIAGSHMITSKYFNTYKNLSLDINEDKICFAISPILVPFSNNHYIYKYNRSKWESSLELPENEEYHWITLKKGDKEINLGVFLCIDGLRKPFHNTEKEHALIIVPSWSPSVDPFDAAALQAIYNELPLVYANTSIIGGSKMSATFPEADRHWFADRDSTKSIPKNSECLLTVKYDLANIRRSKSTVREHLSAEIIDVRNLLYSLNVTNEEIIDALSNLEDQFNEQHLSYLNSNSSDELLRLKLLEISQKNRMGILRKDKLAELCRIVTVPEISYNDLKQELIEDTLSFLTSHVHLLKNTDVLTNLSVVSSKSVQIKQNKQETIKTTSEMKPFFDRDLEQRKLRDFFNTPSEKLLIIQGIRGIGKSLLLEQLQKRILPPNNPWKTVVMRFNRGMGFPLFLDDIAYQLGIQTRFDVGKAENVLPAIRDLLASLESYRAAYIVIDDFQNILDKEGAYLDSRFKTFLDEFLRRSVDNCKIIIATNRNVNFDNQEEAFNNKITLRGLNDDSIRAIVDYHYKNISGRIEGINVPNVLIQNLYGNPLAAVITAQYLQNHPVSNLVISTELFRRYQEQLITNLLEEIEFKADEKELLNFISTSKNDVSSFILHNWRPGLYDIIDSLCSRFLLEFNPEKETYSLHPLIHDYYYNELLSVDRIKFHFELAELNRKKLLEIQQNNQIIPPKLVGELIYHYAGSLQREKLLEYGSHYQDELLPIADQLYKDKKHNDALDYYLLLLDIGLTRRLDVIENICMCYGNLNKWDEAREYFNEALSIRNKVSLYAKFSHLMAVKTRNFNEAESYAMQGEELYLNSSTKRLWEYAKIKSSLGKIRERQNQNDCLILYKDACELDKTNVYYKFQYAKSLIRWGYDADEVITQGLLIQKDYPPLLTLKAELTHNDDDFEDSFEDIEEEVELLETV